MLPMIACEPCLGHASTGLSPALGVHSTACPQPRTIVVTTAEEALRVSRFLSLSRSSAEVERIVDRAQSNFAAAGQPGAAPESLRCPLVDDRGSCTAYHVRPQACRPATTSATGPAVYDLSGALVVALSEPEPWQRWSNDESIFADCRWTS
jgi:hypothetical protein